MPRKIEQGKAALFKYNKIRYSFVELDAGEQQILTNDPWSFLSSNLQLRLTNSRGNNKKKIERATYYSGLAVLCPVLYKTQLRVFFFNTTPLFIGTQLNIFNFFDSQSASTFNWPI